MADKKVRKPKTYAPSLAGRCLRYTVMDLLGFGRELSPESLAAMHAGSALHKSFQQGLAGTCEVVGVEVPLKAPDLRVSGRIDAVIREDSHNIAVEYKTVHEEKFVAIKEGGPLFDHWAQLALYVNIGEYFAGRLIVENRSGGQQLSWPLYPDRQWKAWLLQRIEAAQAFQDERSLPEREIGTHCLHCDRWKRCFKTEELRAAGVAEHPIWSPSPPAPPV